jgi:hypothetical protein
MEWHYELNRRSEGPVSATKLRELRQAGIILDDTQIWGESLDGWTKYSECQEAIERSALTEDLGLVPTPGEVGQMAVCAWSGRSYPEAEMLRYGDLWVAPEYKEVFVQSLQEGQSFAPRSGDHEERVTDLNLATILTQSFSIWKSNFWILLVATLVVWLPFDLLQYLRSPSASFPESEGGMELFGIQWTPYDRSAQMLQNFLTIVSTGVAMFVSHQSWRRKPAATIVGALQAGIKNWLRILGTDILFGLFAVFLAIPGVLLIATGHWATIAIGITYLIAALGIFVVRNGFSSSIAVGEACGGSFALEKSREITKGRFWRILLYQSIVLGGVYGFVFGSAFIYFLPFTDNLAVTLIQSVAINLVLTFGWVEICVLHRHLEANPFPVKP